MSTTKRTRTTVLTVALASATVLGTLTLSPVATAAPENALSTARTAGEDVERPQGEVGPLKSGTSGRLSSSARAAAVAGAPITRSTVIARAKTWVDAQVPYSMNNYRDGYRTDCSGLISMAWDLGTNAWTGNLDTFATRISKSELKKGDMLLFHNPSNPTSGSHVVLFERWTDSSKTSYVGIEQTPPHAVRRTIPYSYFNNSDSYLPYRYKNIVEDAPAAVFTQTAAADFDGDGEADIIARDASAALKMWKHNSGGYFNSPVDVTGGWHFTQTVTGDFNSDSKSDIIAKDGDGNLKMWLGHGDGTFGAANQVTGGWNFTQTAAADFDGNGKTDLIAKDADGNLKIWAGRGDKTFGSAQQLSTNWNYTQTVAADFDGDGEADIMAKDATGNLKLWTHNSGGYFNAPVNVTSGWNFSQTTAADFDGNGKADLIARNDSTGDLTIWAGRGDGTFGSPAKLTSGW
ncbi:FG-GAP-like repeat-containing protein [Streptomyces violaceoruber]|uniref:C40 family peptidase n=1 Tax=Streptomyces violaceoruber group TaxID=2867121 RepID=UPI0033CE751C|nr:FG-GAP-like repeat-containing protein [Streptomyces anthocyanicus]